MYVCSSMHAFLKEHVRTRAHSFSEHVDLFVSLISRIQFPRLDLTLLSSALNPDMNIDASLLRITASHVDYAMLSIRSYFDCSGLTVKETS